ncbi:MAG: hypothetical protein LBR83_01560 [Clostridiales bacterium]|jgi:hypothetical protein|nr:hypothetical protein [Clostridiales bacterium]
MRYMECDTPDNTIRRLKYADEGETIRLTFQWPVAIAQVYIFKVSGGFDIGEASPGDAKLFTLPEYKKLGGYMERKTPGEFTYYIFPFIRDAGEDVAVVQLDGGNRITFMAGQYEIKISIKEKTSPFSGVKTHEISLFSENPIGADALCYVKKENGYPSRINDGVTYPFAEPLPPGETLTRKITTKKNEFIRLFVRDTEKAAQYSLKLR